jgi:hypothetical protein
MAGMEWDQPTKLDPHRVPGRRRQPGTNPIEAFQEFSKQWSTAALHGLKPGGHLAALAAPRTAHRLTCGLEEAGLEVRDVLMWIQGQGYPGSGVTPSGWGTCLKPAYEPIILARKPVARALDHNLLAHGTGALNIDACRIEPSPQDCPAEGRTHKRFAASEKGRWPANLLLSHGHRCTAGRCERDCPIERLGDRHRFFYTAKAPRREREAGCERLPRSVVQTFKIGDRNEQQCKDNPAANIHPTVKPIELMRWLVRLLTPPDGLVLDPFAGSGGAGAAAVLEGARFLGIERDTTYVPIARARIKYWAARRPRDRGACRQATPRAPR